MPNASLSALRAVSVIILRRLLRPFQFMAIVLLAAGWVSTILLSVAFSTWWLLLLILVVPLTVAFVVAKVISMFLFRLILPRRLSRAEQSRIMAFCDKLMSVAERTQTPYFVLLFIIGKDVVRRRESTFLSGLIGDSKDLLHELGEIQRLFQE